jgi:hypothetical protein
VPRHQPCRCHLDRCRTAQVAPHLVKARINCVRGLAKLRSDGAAFDGWRAARGAAPGAAAATGSDNAMQNGKVHLVPLAFAVFVVQCARGPVEAAGIFIGLLRHGQSKSSRWRQGCATTGRTAFCARRRQRRRFCGRRRGHQRWAAADSERGALICVRQRGFDLDGPRTTLPRSGHHCCPASWASGCTAPPLRGRCSDALQSLKWQSTH